MCVCVMRDPNEEALYEKKMLAEADVKYVHRLTPNKRGHPLALFRLGRSVMDFSYLYLAIFFSSAQVARRFNLPLKGAAVFPLYGLLG